MTYNLKAIKKEFKDNGIFYTPPELAELVKSYVDIEPSSVYDPTCGDGGLLAVFPEDIPKYGQEINEHQIEVAMERLSNFNGYCGDTLKDPAFLGIKFDCIVANPPFSIQWQPMIDSRFENAPTIPSKSKADYAFLLHILDYLSDNGIAIVLSFPGVLYRGNREGQIRQWLVEQNFIERVVLIPPDTFVDTSISTAIIVMRKNKKTTDIVFEDKALEKSRTVSFDEVKENAFNLSVNHYIQEIVQEIIYDPFELQDNARREMLTRLKQDIEIDNMVSYIEERDNADYINAIIDLASSYLRTNNASR